MRYIDIPAIVLECLVVEVVGVAKWPYDDGTADPFWEGGSQPRDYRWRARIDITEQTHSSHKTRKPYAYTGADVRVGHYIADVQYGTALKVVGIEEKTDSKIVCILEDVFRYNTYRYAGLSGAGIFNIPSMAIIFELNEEGLPVVDPVPASGVGTAFYANLMSRFQNMEQNVNFLLEKENHGFVPDQLIAADADNNTFVLADANHPYIVGTVAHTNISPNLFTINPIQKVLDNFDHLIGEVGDVIYADPDVPGGVTLAAGGQPIMIKLRDWSPSSVVSTVTSPTTATGNRFMLNGVPITIGGTGVVGDFVAAVNGETPAHGVTATLEVAPTVAQTGLTMAYGEPAMFAPEGGPYATAAINGVLVTFTTITAGRRAYGMDVALEEDLAEDINAAAIPGVTATASGNNLFLHNVTGGPITIANGIPDVNGTPFAGPNSGSGLPLATPASTGGFVRLDAVDARAINLHDMVGTPTLDFGLVSVENGQKAAALYIEQGLRSASVNVVTNIAARNALRAMIGDQAHVLDKGDGEWGLYLYDGLAWNLIASHESAKVDADTYRLTVTPGSPAEGVIGEVNGGTRVLVVTVSVDEVFDGGATLTVGDDGNPTRLMSADLNDLRVAGSYSFNPTHVYAEGGDTEIKYYLNAAECTVGTAVITVSYA